MAAVNRGQPPARHTKVVDSYPSPLKEDRPQKNSKPDSRPGNDVSLSKSSERSQTDEAVGNTTTVYQCRKPRCKTCKHLREGDKFTSNVTGKTYSVQSRNQVMTCETKNVIYVISCCRCGIQYVGETSQMLRQRMNNHRSRLKKVGVQYLYKHYCSAGHSEDDITIMPIEEVDVSDKHVSSTSKRLQQEQYWYRELKCIYPYGLNDNVKDIGNVSKVNKDSIVIWNLFNHTTRKFRKRPRSSKKRHRNQHRDIEQELMNIVSTYRTIGFINKLRVYILGLPRTCMGNF